MTAEMMQSALAAKNSEIARLTEELELARKAIESQYVCIKYQFNVFKHLCEKTNKLTERVQQLEGHRYRLAMLLKSRMNRTGAKYNPSRKKEE